MIDNAPLFKWYALIRHFTALSTSIIVDVIHL